MLRRGFGGFAYQHIAVQLGIRNAAIHYHFPSKDDLGVALVQRYRGGFHAWVADLPSGWSSWQTLRAYFETYGRYLQGEACRLCPGGALAAEFETLPEPMRHEVRLLMRDIHQWLSDTLETGRREGVLRFQGQPSDKAIELAAALQGGLQTARLIGTQRFYQLLDQLALELTGETPACDAGAMP